MQARGGRPPSSALRGVRKDNATKKVHWHARDWWQQKHCKPDRVKYADDNTMETGSTHCSARIKIGRQLSTPDLEGKVKESEDAA